MWKRTIPKETSPQHETLLLRLGALSVAFLLVARLLPLGAPERDRMRRASEMMADAMSLLKKCRSTTDLSLQEENDPNRTGLIGEESSPLTTSRGSLEAKRTTTNPNFAALLVYLLRQAGVEEDDTVALGASGSFPALIVATLSAVRAMHVRALTIYSIGASQWGANETDFTWLHMEGCLREAGWLATEPIAVSLGGDSDTGPDWNPHVRQTVEAMAARTGAVVLEQPDLRANVEARMRLYDSRAGGEPLRAFINIGGAWANMGESADVLYLRPGLVEINRIPPARERGVIFEMGSRGVPVIHLLYIKGLVERYGLPWDPVPLPSPGEGSIYQLAKHEDPVFPALALTYLSVVVVFLVFRSRARVERLNLR